MAFQQKLDAAVSKNNSLLCVGLDPEFQKIPEKFKEEKYPQFSFNKWIIDQTYNLVCSFKPNSAFYEARGAAGIEELKMTREYIRSNHPDIPILLDFKRGDVGNTNNGYVQFAFDYLHVDAVTVNPYLGRKALQPFLDRTEKGIFILCKTSNPGSGEFQNVVAHLGAHEVDQGRPLQLYKYVAQQVSTVWNTHNNCFLVVGATYPEELASVRKIVGDMTILVPGIGPQKGELKRTLQAGLTSKKAGMIINASRGIIFAQNPKIAAQKLRDEINNYRSNS